MTAKPAIENEIVQLLHEGDKRAIQLAYANYGETVYGIVLRIVKTAENAEEVLQDTFIKMWKYGHSYNPSKGRFFTWLINIARNVCFDLLKSGKNIRAKKTDSLDSPVYDHVEIADTQNLGDSGLANVIKGLEEKYRKIIEMVYFEGYSQSEISKELDIPLGTVKSRLRIAIKALRVELKDEIAAKLLVLFIILQILFLNT